MSASDRLAVSTRAPAGRDRGPRTPRDRRHERIERAVAREIAATLRRLDLGDGRMLHLQAAAGGQQTLLFRDQLGRAARPVVYDFRDVRDPEVSAQSDFAEVDLEAAAFPAPDDGFDLVIWNREIVTLKNFLPALGEARRVLRPGGVMIVTAPNLAALHNRLLLLAGFQPTTLHISQGDHVRGLTSRAMTRLLRGLPFEIQRITGVGLAPVSGAVQPRFLRGVSHTVMWVLRKPDEVT
jgi:SAM-dependent methyltransferase